jgi:hypothetical protein
MAGSHVVRFVGSEADMSSFWLPPNTLGNGLPAASWAVIAETDPASADRLLRSLTRARVPARLAPPTPGRPRCAVRVFVDPSCHSRAENVLLAEMNRSVPSRSRGDGEPEPDTSPPTRAEAKQLWWFCDGAIMDVGTRDRLWRARGLCPRHSWMFFCAEIELKWQPLGVAVLYADLAGRMVDSLGHRWSRTRALRTRDTCPTCDFVGSTAQTTGFADERDRMAAGTRTADWVAASRPVWSGVVCARCEPAPARSRAVPCRMHLLADPTSEALARVTDYLPSLAARLRACVRTMTHEGPPHTPDSDAALVEALGWFAGWRAGRPYLAGPA